MKSTGIVRKVDELGRVVIPIELRRTLNIGEKDALEIFTEGDTIILRAYKPLCYICGAGNDLKTYKNKRICVDCITESQKLL